MTDSQHPDEQVDRDAIRARTELLHRSSEAPWPDLRKHLKDAGVKPREAAMAIMFRDDSSIDYGLIVSIDGRVFECDVEIGGRLERGRIISTPPWVANWQELHGIEKEEVFPPEVQAALTFLKKGDV
jgi:hypothetical protein